VVAESPIGPPPGRRLVLVRHGRTSWNAEGRAQGHADVSLDDTGRDQAEAMAPAVAAYDPVLLVSSDLARARETAAFLEKETGLTATEDVRLREHDLGERTGLTREESAERFDGEAAWDVHAHADVPGAESAEQVALRIVPASLEVLELLRPGETAVLVVHGAASRIAVTGLLGWPVGTADGLAALDNCAWAVLEDSRQGRLRLSGYNLAAPLVEDAAEDAPEDG
jgi:broad specificity phosphatase PhoE